MNYDGYEGWIFCRDLMPLTEDSDFPEKGHKKYLVSQPFQRVHNPYSRFYLGLGTPLPFYDGENCFLKGWTFQVDSPPFEVSDDPGNCLEIANRFLGTPYLWGGRSSYGIDCSGFTQILLRYSNKNISRDAKDQINEGRPVKKLEESQTGDLAFFENEKGNIIHSGFIKNPKAIIHASGKVRSDQIDENGIWNDDLKQYTHQLAGIRRYF